MHCYLYVQCKNERCPAAIWLAHEEWPDVDFTFIDFPDEAFPVSIHCGACRHFYQYSAKDVRTKTSIAPEHPPDWKPLIQMKRPSGPGNS